MILLADSGSTKTDWRLIDNADKIHEFRTSGFNPYYQSSSEISNGLSEELIPQLKGRKPESICFYGAGCSTGGKQDIVKSALQNFFPESKTEVQSDLIGAARALCGHKPGIACILGTGSGSCSWNGEKIIEQIPSLGFILGDEGSGAWLGKKLITAFLRNKLTPEIHNDLENSFHINKEEILKRVNKEEMPSRYLATFAKFYSSHLDDSYIYELAYNSFSDFAKNYIIRYQGFQSNPVHFVGSVAFHNRKVLEQLAQSMNFKVKNIISNPIEGLIHYHTQN
jgi:N-acetylglucosamine kinase-like BadF-type ATPase